MYSFLHISSIRVRVNKPISAFRSISQFFKNIKIRVYLLNITFVSYRCRGSLAAVTPIKYVWGFMKLKSTSARLKFSVREKLTNKTLVTPGIMGSLLVPILSVHFRAFCINLALYERSDKTDVTLHSCLYKTHSISQGYTNVNTNNIWPFTLCDWIDNSG